MKIVAAVFLPVALVLFWFSKIPVLQGLDIGLALFALAGLIVDYFSPERASTYCKIIVKEFDSIKN